MAVKCETCLQLTDLDPVDSPTCQHCGGPLHKPGSSRSDSLKVTKAIKATKATKAKGAHGVAEHADDPGSGAGQSLEEARLNLAALAAEAAAAHSPGDRRRSVTSPTITINPDGSDLGAAQPAGDQSTSTSMSLVPVKGQGADHLPVLSGITMFGQAVATDDLKKKRLAAEKRAARAAEREAKRAMKGTKLGPGSGVGLLIAWSVLALLVIGLLAVTVLLANAG